jgi:hypothetical protein
MQLEIVESKHSTSRNQINLLLYLIYDRSLPQMYEFWIHRQRIRQSTQCAPHTFSQVLPSIVRATIASPLKIVSIFSEYFYLEHLSISLSDFLYVSIFITFYFIS